MHRPPRQRQRLVRRHAGFVRATVDIDLKAQLQRRHRHRPLLAQALGNFEAVNRMGPIKVDCNQPRFIALNRANAMPFNGRIPQIRQRCNFVHTFLDVVFAKRPLPGGVSLAHGIGAKRLGNCQ